MNMRTGGRIRNRPGTSGLLVLIGAVTLLSGCSSEMSDLRQFVENARATERRPIPKLPELRPHETFTYDAGELRDPFAAIAFNQAQPGARSDRSHSGPRPDENRPREALEGFPLDSLRMVGVLEQEQSMWALVRASDGTIHRVTEGNYLGQNHGRILNISENNVALVEIVPDGLGGYQERRASLALSE